MTERRIRAAAWLGLEPGERVAVKASGRDLPAALRELFAALPGSIDADPGKDLAALPDAVRGFLARLCRATALAARERAAAVAELSGEEWVKLRQYGSQINTGMPVESQAPLMRSLGAH